MFAVLLEAAIGRVTGVGVEAAAGAILVTQQAIFALQILI
jgi:hypothetical protein